MSDDEYEEPPHTITELDVITQNIKLVKFSFRDIIRYMIPWTYNRSINEERVEELYNTLSQTGLAPPWTFHVVHDSKNPSDMYYIIDGAHRAKAIYRYIEA
eukprot:765740-Hanusia_phi.AAC.2